MKSLVKRKLRNNSKKTLLLLKYTDSYGGVPFGPKVTKL
jgi:hypothetical protein